MKLELKKEIKTLIDEIPMDFEINNNIITIDSVKNMIGHYEVIDGNHRFAMLINSNRIEDGEYYMIDSTILESAGYLEDCENQEDYESFVRKNGTKIELFDYCIV